MRSNIFKRYWSTLASAETHCYQDGGIIVYEEMVLEYQEYIYTSQSGYCSLPNKAYLLILSANRIVVIDQEMDR